jgi:hypothetical protein
MGDQKAHVTVKPSSDRKILNRSNKGSCSGSSPETKIKLFYDKKEKKVMYAECNKEFVDLALGFLSYPLGCVIKNMPDGAEISSLGNGGFDNLYTSAIDLDATGFITSGYIRLMLLNPSLSPFSSHCNILVEDNVERREEFYMGLPPYSWNRRNCGYIPETTCRGCHCNLVIDRKYVVNDDFLMHQASAMAVSKHWCRRDKANVVEMEITIRKQDVRKFFCLCRTIVTSSWLWLLSMTSLSCRLLTCCEQRSPRRRC